MTLIFKKLKLFEIQESKVLYLSALIADGSLREVLKFGILSLSKVTRAQRRADDVHNFRLVIMTHSYTLMTHPEV